MSFEPQVSSFWFSVPEIYREGTTNGRLLRGIVYGKWILIRSDYPVLVTMDGERIGVVGSPAGNPWMIFEAAKDGRHEFTLGFVRLFGADPTGAFNYVEEEMVHGVGLIQGAYQRDALTLP